MFKIINHGTHFTIEDGSETYGPYSSYEEMDREIMDNDLEVMYTPKDLIFDVYSVDCETYIFLDLKEKVGHDNLGSHNVQGLPYNLDNESELYECHWLITNGKTKEEIIQDMILAGFSYVDFFKTDDESDDESDDDE